MDKIIARQTEIARAVGVSVATVSLALSNSPRISERRRNEIRAVAESLRYRLDQAGKTLQSRRSHQQQNETVAVITFFPEDWGNPGTHWASGLTQHLHQLGYRLDVFAQPTDPAGWRGLSRSILARGIRGVLLHCRNDNPAAYPLPWDQLATVAWSGDVASHFSPNLTAAHFEDTFGMVKTIAERGYRQPALLLFPDHHLPSLSGGFFAGLSAHLPHAHSLTWPVTDSSLSGLTSWIRDHDVDVLCGLVLPEFAARLHTLGLKIPQDVGLCSMDVFTPQLPPAEEMSPATAITGLRQARLRGYRLAATLGCHETTTA
ncbi:MAG TPA: LacI family DNA-binding transcriptional regulator [Opitutaceae bacterium]|nr:LacI family DNA-binding transcriptional regulator [Opitutaceae bacterium]